MVLTETNTNNSSKRLTLGFIVSLMSFCVKHASRVSNKLHRDKNSRNRHHHHHFNYGHDEDIQITNSPKLPPRSPLVKSKQLLSQISNKATTIVRNGSKKQVTREGSEEEFGDGGVWQRSILMGDKCQPLNFSGVIYYDNHGRQLNEIPTRSPRASPLHRYVTRVE